MEQILNIFTTKHAKTKFSLNFFCHIVQCIRSQISNPDSDLEYNEKTFTGLLDQYDSKSTEWNRSEFEV